MKIEFHEYLRQSRRMGTETDHTSYPVLIRFCHSQAPSHCLHKKRNTLFHLMGGCMNIDNSPLSHGTTPLSFTSRYAKEKNPTKNLSIDWLESVRALSINVSLEWIHKKYLNSFPTCRLPYARCFLCGKRATVETWSAHVKIGWKTFMRFLPLFGAINLSYAMPMRHVRSTLCSERNIQLALHLFGDKLAMPENVEKNISTAMKCWTGSFGSISTTSTVHYRKLKLSSFRNRIIVVVNLRGNRDREHFFVYFSRWCWLAHCCCGRNARQVGKWVLTAVSLWYRPCGNFAVRKWPIIRATATN